MTLIKVPEPSNGYTPRGRRRAFTKAYVEQLFRDECKQPCCKNRMHGIKCEEYTLFLKFLEAWNEYQQNCEAHG